MKRTESTNDKIVRLYNEGWSPERISEEITISVGAVNSILERRIPGYAEILAQKSLETNKARTAAKAAATKTSARAQKTAEEAEEAEEAKAAEEPVQAELPEDGGMLIENYKQKITEPESDVKILTAKGNTNLLTGGLDETKTEEKPAVPRTPRRTVKKDVTETPDEPEVKTAARTTARSRLAEKEEAAEPAVKAASGSPTTRAAQKIKEFATEQITENNAKIAEIEAQLAVLTKQANELRSQIASLKIENEQYQAIMK